MLSIFGLLGMAAVGAAAFIGLDSGDEERAAPDSPSDDDIPEDGTSQTAPDLFEQVLSGLSAAPLQTDDSSAPDSAAPMAPDPAPDLAPDPSADGAPDADWQVMIGTDEDDLIHGTSGPDQTNGYAGDDTILGDAAEDVIHGGAGDDLLSGGAGDDTLRGEDDNDVLFGDAGDDLLFGQNGEDRLQGGDGDDTAHGGAGDDTVYGGAGGDALHGGLGKDQLDGGPGQDTLFGGLGDDTLIGAVWDPEAEEPTDLDGRDYLNGGSGADVILAGCDDIVTTGSGADTVILGHWLDAGHQAEILDFSPDEDRLLVVFDDSDGTEPEVTLQPDGDNPDHQRLLLNGEPITRIANAQGLTLDHVSLLPQSELAAMIRP